MSLKVAILSLLDKKLLEFMTSQTGIIIVLLFNVIAI